MVAPGAFRYCLSFFNAKKGLSLWS
jgi:hypothetical protein